MNGIETVEQESHPTQFRQPTMNEIVAVLRAHPLVRLREPVRRAFLVGSFATHTENIHSDVDILLEVAARSDLDENELEEHYRQRLRQYFVTHNIRGKCDAVHPQWCGRRVDLYLTYDVATESRPKIELAQAPALDWRRHARGPRQA